MLPCDRLEAFRLADLLAHAVYDATEVWPRSEMYRMTDQARRAAHSIASNICEGSTRHGPKEYARYLNISTGSLSEFTYALRFARRRGWITEEIWSKLEPLREQTAKTLWPLYLSVKRAAQQANQRGS